MDGPKESLRIGYLVSQYPTATHTFILREIRRLRAAGIDVQTVAVRGSDRPLDALPAEEREEASSTSYVLDAGWGRVALQNVRQLLRSPVRYLRGLGRAMSLAGPDARRVIRYLAYWAQAVVAARLFAQRGVSHAHAHFSSTVAQLLPLAASHDRPLTWSATIHGPDEFNDVVGFNLAEKAAGARFLVAISRFAASQIMRAADPSSWPRLDVVPLGVDTAQYALRAAPGERNGRPAELLCVARLAPVKGQLVLLDAVARLRAAGHDVRLRLVGDGPYRPALERAARERGVQDVVVFEGWRTQAEVRALYRSADVFVLPSFAEGVPVVLMEAMALGVPCVATSVNGVPELIRDGRDGLLAPPADADALATAVQRLLADPTLAADLAVSGRLRVLDAYDLDTNVARLAAVFRHRLRAPSTP